jgi:Uri superfamily endonuclease
MTEAGRVLIGRGTYALLLACRRTGPARIGRLGTLQLQPGFYVYVGSAFGTGGLRARLRHHFHGAPRPHWHIDFLRAICDLAEVWFTTDPVRLEHHWARVMAGLPGAVLPLPGFGSSDCDCLAHLFWFARRPSISLCRRRIKATVSRLFASDFVPLRVQRAAASNGMGFRWAYDHSPEMAAAR